MADAGSPHFREETDSLGPVRVPADRYWGAQTERSRNNFRIGGERMPIEVVRAFGILKKAAALANAELRVGERDLIVAACDQIIAGELLNALRAPT